MESKSYHHGNLREALIEAGIQVVHAEGHAQLSMRRVAAICKVSHAAPYSHFQSKRELLEAMQQHVADRFAMRFRAIVQSYDDRDPRVIDALGVSYVSFFIENPHYYSFLFFKGNLKIDLCLGGEKDSFPAFQIFKDAAEKVYRSAGMSSAQIENTMIIKWSVVHGLAGIATMPEVVYDKDWKAQIKQMLCIDNE